MVLSIEPLASISFCNAHIVKTSSVWPISSRIRVPFKMQTNFVLDQFITDFQFSIFLLIWKRDDEAKLLNDDYYDHFVLDVNRGSWMASRPQA